jgi:type I restriction enzyme S subunit
MRKYDSYKDSGIEWLGKVPEHWKYYRIDRTASLVRGNTGLLKDELLDKGEYVALQYGKTYKVDEVDNKFDFFVNSEYYKKGQIVNFGDTVLISTSETIEDLGHSCFYNRRDLGLLGGEQILLKPIKKIISEKYLYYYSKFFKYELQKYATGLKVFRFNIDDLKEISIVIPSKEEQIIIAQYLDAKTHAIDKKINLLEKKIRYYKELRKSIINETVTKGLDKTAKFQENDLGFNTPLTWSKKRLKDVGFLYSGLSGKGGDDFNQDDNPNNKGFIPFTNIANNTYLKKDHLGTVVVFDGEKQNKVKEGDIFFLMSSEGYEDIGKSAVLAENIDDTYLNSFCKGFRIKQKNCNPYFLNYLLLSDYYRQILIIEGKGFTRINLKMEKVNDFEVYLPKNLSEQSDIVTYLDHKTQTIDKIIGNIQKQISIIKELRKTLINDVVTGKIKVVE